MGPKPKLHQKTGKTKISLQSVNNETRMEPSLSPEMAQRFELELCWCIQQLQRALKSGKLNTKQTHDHTKALNTLMNNSASLIKKRQVMRLSFGDYRAKMLAEDQKLTPVNSRIKVFTASPSKKSMFLKKSSGNNFRFDFPQPEADIISEQIRDVSLDDNSKHSFDFKTSDNSFKFNFNIDE